MPTDQFVIDEYLIPKSDFIAMKNENKRVPGVEADGADWFAEVRQMMDFKLKRCGYRTRNGKLDSVRLDAATLIVMPRASDISAASDELNVEISRMYWLV